MSSKNWTAANKCRLSIELLAALAVDCSYRR
jgi:hypothetical protein